MATNKDFIDFVCEQILGAGFIRSKKMFGEYMVYVNEKPILLVCGNTCFVKILPCISEIMQNADKGFPYNGAKEHYILDIDDADFAKKVIMLLEQNTPLPKPRKKKAE